jgi:hypothetical protein
VPDKRETGISFRLKGAADASHHTREANLLALVKFLARRAAEADFEAQRHAADRTTNTGERS